MRNGARARYLPAAYYGSLAFVLVTILGDFLDVLLPVGAKQISHNSEAIGAAIVLGLWIQFARPRLHDPRRARWEWPVTAGAALGSLGVGLVFYHAESWPTRVTTLNETLFALAFLIPFLQGRRRVPWAAPAVSGLVLAVIVFGGGTGPVTDTAETLAFLLLVPLGLDVVDRGVLDPDAVTRPPVRRCWYALLAAVPVAFHILQYRIGPQGWLGDFARYGVRLNEAFLLMLVLSAYFAVGLGRTGRSGRSAARTAIPPKNRQPV